MSDPDYIFNNTLDSSDILDVSAITGLDLDLSSSSDIIPGGIRGFDNIDNEAEYINSKKTDFIFSSEDKNSRSMTTRSSKSRSIGLKFHESDERSSMFGARRNLVNNATNMSIIAHNGSQESLSVSLQEASKINEVSLAFSDPSTTTKTSILKPIELRTSTPTPTYSFLTSASVDRSATSATGSATKLQHEPKPKFSANISILSTTNNCADVQLEMKLPGINAVSSSTSCSAGANYLQELGAGLFTIGQNSTVNIYVSKCVNCTGKSGCGVQPVPLPISAKEATSQSDQGPSRINIIANNAENCNLFVANPHGDGEIQENELLEESKSEPSPTLPTYINSNNTSPTPTPTPSNTVISPLIPCNDNDINSNFNSFIVRRARFNPYLTPKEPVVIDETETQDDSHSRSHTMVVHLQDSSTPTPTPTHINSTMPVESSQVLSSLKRRGPGRPRKQTKTKSLKTSKVPQTEICEFEKQCSSRNLTALSNKLYSKKESGSISQSKFLTIPKNTLLKNSTSTSPIIKRRGHLKRKLVHRSDEGNKAAIIKKNPNSLKFKPPKGSLLKLKMKKSNAVVAALDENETPTTPPPLLVQPVQQSNLHQDKESMPVLLPIVTTRPRSPIKGFENKTKKVHSDYFLEETDSLPRITLENYKQLFDTLVKSNIVNTENGQTKVDKLMRVCRVPNCNFETESTMTADRKLKDHFLLHCDPRLFVCPVCDRNYQNTCSLTRHYKLTNHNNVSIPNSNNDVDFNKFSLPKIKPKLTQKKKMKAKSGAKANPETN